MPFAWQEIYLFVFTLFDDRYTRTQHLNKQIMVWRVQMQWCLHSKLILVSMVGKNAGSWCIDGMRRLWTLIISLYKQRTLFHALRCTGGKEANRILLSESKTMLRPNLQTCQLSSQGFCPYIRTLSKTYGYSTHSLKIRSIPCPIPHGMSVWQESSEHWCFWFGIQHKGRRSFGVNTTLIHASRTLLHKCNLRHTRLLIVLQTIQGPWADKDS